MLLASNGGGVVSKQRVIVAAAMALLSLSSPANAQSGRYSGVPLVELDGDGRKLKLMRSLTYWAPSGKEWRVPAGVQVDGASIPQPFWTLIGGPLEGKYRDASIIHDFYCDRKTRPWRDVHRVFFDGMITSGVEVNKAKIMYYAVYRFGPRWEAASERVPVSGFDGSIRMEVREFQKEIPSVEYNQESAERAVNRISKENLSLDDIENMSDAETSLPPR